MRCKVQWFNGASNMLSDAKTGVATRISATDSHAHLKIWHGFALQLAVGDII